MFNLDDSGVVDVESEFVVQMKLAFECAQVSSTVGVSSPLKV